MRKTLVSVLVLLTAFSCCVLCGCSESGNNTELLSVVAVSRHGIRSQTSTLAELNAYTLRPEGFPRWPAPADTPGYLSTFGLQNVTRLGAWYRDYYASQSLLPERGACPAAGTVFVYADNMERTIQTGQGYLDGMFQAEATADCGFQVVHSSLSKDPYINALEGGICKVDTAADQAAFNTKTGGNPASLTATYAAQLQMLQTVTQCCQLSACTFPGYPAPTSCSLLVLPSVVVVNSKTGMLEFGPLFGVAQNLAEIFELEYAQGMPETGCATTSGAQCVGWGAIPTGGLLDMMKLHVLYFDLMFRLPSFAGADSSNLLWQVMGTMDQTLTGVKNADMLAPATSKFTLFVAHDDNISAIGALLGDVKWQAEGYQQDDPGPAGALVFELYKIKKTGQAMVRLFYVIATLDQMRNGTTLTLQNPPQRVALAIPACGGTDCTYDQFKTLIAGAVRQDCLVKTASAR